MVTSYVFFVWPQFFDKTKDLIIYKTENICLLYCAIVADAIYATDTIDNDNQDYRENNDKVTAKHAYHEFKIKKKDFEIGVKKAEKEGKNRKVRARKRKSYSRT